MDSGGFRLTVEANPVAVRIPQPCFAPEPVFVGRHLIEGQPGCDQLLNPDIEPRAFEIDGGVARNARVGVERKRGAARAFKSGIEVCGAINDLAQAKRLIKGDRRGVVAAPERYLIEQRRGSNRVRAD